MYTMLFWEKQKVRVDFVIMFTMVGTSHGPAVA
jgi:hypothetical protein